ncbi:MAG: hypothetical protein R3C28_14370 [Pirellulaceae bacterium]
MTSRMTPVQRQAPSSSPIESYYIQSTGSAGDADGIVNGLISDPVALAFVAGQAGDDYITTNEDESVNSIQLTMMHCRDRL